MEKQQEVIFEITIPMLSRNKERTLLTNYVWSTKREYIDAFIKQHNLKVYDVDVVETYDPRDINPEYELRVFKFKSNKNTNEEYSIVSSMDFIRQCVDSVCGELSESCIFGSAILHNKIPIIDIINRCIEKLPYVFVLDYSMLDDYREDDPQYVYKHMTSPLCDNITTDPDDSDIYEQMHDDVLFDSCGYQPVTTEAYVSFMASLLTDEVYN